MNVAIATLMAVLANIGAPGLANIGAPGNHQGGQQYEVIWTIPRPAGFPCKLAGAQLEPNYGQAVKLEKTLTQEGYRAAIIPPQATPISTRSGAELCAEYLT